MAAFDGVQDVKNKEPLRVVLAEDSPILRDRLIESVTVPGVIDVIGHADTELATLAFLRERAWDALILDLQLRQGSGLGVLRGLMGQRAAGTTVIVLTNFAIPQYRTRSLQLGADHFLDKARDYGKVRDLLLELVSGRAEA